MTTRVLVLAPDESIEAAVIKLLSRGLSGAPVCDGDRVIRGVLSEFDCIRVLAETAFEGWPTGTVRDWMTTDVESVPPNEDVFAMAGRMAKSRHRRLVVVEDGRLLGVVSRPDIFRALAKHIDEPRKPTTYELIANPPKGQERI